MQEAVEGLGGGVAPEVSYRVSFERRPDGLPVITGTVSADITLTCQRCLDPVEIRIDAPLALALVRSEEAAASVPQDLDPLVLTDDEMSPLDLIEDEVLLGIPSVPRHETGRCPSGALTAHDRLVAGDRVGAPEDGGASEKRPNPFAVLASLKRE